MGIYEYDPVSYAFRDSMRREGRECMVWSTKETFHAFFRKDDDANNIEDKIKIYYKKSAPLHPGSVIVVGNKKYIFLNQETEENDIYLKSSAMAINGEVNTNDGDVNGIPVYGYDTKNALADTNNTISVVSGNMEYLAEDNNSSHALKLNQTFNVFGRTWKIENLYYKDGICHVITKVYADVQPTINTYDILIDGLSPEYKVGTSISVKATCEKNGNAVDGTIEWSVSDDTIATITQDGTVMFIKEGAVNIVAKWFERNLTKESDVINVKPIGADVAPTITISGSKTISYVPHTYTVSIKDAKGDDVLEYEWTWNVTYQDKYNALEFNKTINKDKSITLKVTHPVSGATITLEVVHEGKVVQSFNINVK